MNDLVVLPYLVSATWRPADSKKDDMWRTCVVSDELARLICANGGEFVDKETTYRISSFASTEQILKSEGRW